MDDGVAPPLRFVIDETSLEQAAQAGADALGEALEVLTAAIQRARPHAMGKLSSIWELPLGAHTLADWLFQRANGVDADTAKAISQALDRTPDWDDEPARTLALDTAVEIAGTPADAASVAFAVRERANARATACLSASPARKGSLAVSAGERAHQVHFVACEATHLAFFRDVPEVEDLAEDAYFENAAFAFPAITFFRERTRFRSFQRSYREVRPVVTLHLSVLNDDGRRILASTDDAATKETKLRIAGVVASGENSNTKGNAEAMRQRQVPHAGGTVTCDWHTKLEGHQDRIYFNATSHEQVIVGVFAKHLD